MGEKVVASEAVIASGDGYVSGPARRFYWPPYLGWLATLLFIAVAVCVFLFTCNDPFIFGGPGPAPAWFSNIGAVFGGPPGPPGPPPGGPPPRDAFACPRPTGIIGVQPGFNDQEREVRELRRLAFENQFFAQIELGKRYSAVRSSDRNIEAPIEAAVWYAIALANPEGYTPLRVAHGPPGFWPVGRVEDCRMWERHAAYRALDRLLAHMSGEEQAKVKGRVIYVLSTLNSVGFRTLGRIFDDQFGPYGEPIDDPEVLEAVGRPPGGPDQRGWREASLLFTKNDVDSYLYNYLAMQTGDVSGYVTLKEFEHSAPDRVSIGGFGDSKAKRWVPPYEFYPPESPISGVPFSDMSRLHDDAWDFALARMTLLPFVKVGQAFFYLGITNYVAERPDQLTPHDVQTLQAMLGLQMDGVLTPRLSVRAIQYAAVNGSPQSELTLAIMYEEGVGVPADYARSYYWFCEADRKGSPEAKFAMSTFFAKGVEGVSDQDKAKAVVLRLASAMAGFAPSAVRLQAMLAQVAYAPPRAVE